MWSYKLTHFAKGLYDFKNFENAYKKDYMMITFQVSILDDDCLWKEL
jgi:hypothetical protein